MVFASTAKEQTNMSVYKTTKSAATGDMVGLRDAYEQGCPWDERTCSYAAKNGHLDCLKYAHEHGCPWNDDEWTCEFAAKNGHLDCLQYAHEQ